METVMNINDVQISKMLQFHVKVKMIQEVLDDIAGKISYFRSNTLPELHRTMKSSNHTMDLKELQELFNLIDIDINERCEDMYKISTNIQKSFDNLWCLCNVIRTDKYGEDKRLEDDID